MCGPLVFRFYNSWLACYTIWQLIHTHVSTYAVDNQSKFLKMAHATKPSLNKQLIGYEMSRTLFIAFSSYVHLPVYMFIPPLLVSQCLLFVFVHLLYVGIYFGRCVWI